MGNTPLASSVVLKGLDFLMPGMACEKQHNVGIELMRPFVDGSYQN